MAWPRKRRLLGVDLTVTDYRQAVTAICEAARQRQGGSVSALAIHPVMLGTVCEEYGRVVNSLDMATPDGQGVRWALNWIYRAGLRDRVYGPRLMLEAAQQAAREGLPIYLYGSTQEVLRRLTLRLKERLPDLKIVGVRPPPFRALTPEETDCELAAIRQSGARIVFVGLGCPRQEAWICEQRAKLDAVLIAVGAAFDFLSGNKPQAPAWVQRCGLEMVFRAGSEPRRLWRRLVYFSPPFVLLVLLQRLGLAAFLGPGRIRILGISVVQGGGRITLGDPGIRTCNHDSTPPPSQPGDPAGRPADALYPVVRVVIPAHRATGTLRGCLQALVNAPIKGRREIVVVDDGENDQLESCVAGLPVEVRISNPPGSAARARNLGSAGFQGEVLVFVDADVRVEPEALNRLIDPVVEGLAEASVGNYSRQVAGLPFAQGYKSLYLNRVYSRARGCIRNEYWAALGALKTEVFRRVGGFAPSYAGCLGEDTELGQRLTAAGHRLRRQR